MRGKIWLCIIITLIFGSTQVLASSKQPRDKNKDLGDLKRITEQLEVLLTSNTSDINKFGKLLGIKLIRDNSNQYYDLYQASLPPFAVFQNPDVRIPKDKNKIPFVVLGINGNTQITNSDVQSLFGKADRIDVPTPNDDIKVNWVYKRPGGHTDFSFDKVNLLKTVSFHYDD